MSIRNIKLNFLSYPKTTCQVSNSPQYYGVSGQKKRILFAATVGDAITPIFYQLVLQKQFFRNRAAYTID